MFKSFFGTPCPPWLCAAYTWLGNVCSIPQRRFFLLGLIPLVSGGRNTGWSPEAPSPLLPVRAPSWGWGRAQVSSGHPGVCIRGLEERPTVLITGVEIQGSTGRSPASWEQLCHSAFVPSEALSDEALALCRTRVLEDGWNVRRRLGAAGLSGTRPPGADQYRSLAFTAGGRASAWERPRAPTSSCPSWDSLAAS